MGEFNGILSLSHTFIAQIVGRGSVEGIRGRGMGRGWGRGLEGCGSMIERSLRGGMNEISSHLFSTNYYRHRTEYSFAQIF